MDPSALFDVVERYQSKLVSIDAQIEAIKDHHSDNQAMKDQKIADRRVLQAQRSVYQEALSNIIAMSTGPPTAGSGSSSSSSSTTGKVTAVPRKLKTLSDGFPLLRQNLTQSSPFVPASALHAGCHGIESDFPCHCELPAEILEGHNSLLTTDACRNADGDMVVNYATEHDIAKHVSRFVQDIISAMNLTPLLSLYGEVSVKQIRPDVCVVYAGMFLAGVIEVKKPGEGVLLRETVLGELMDEMLLIGGFYGVGPALGILTTGEEWRVAWFQGDTETLAHSPLPSAAPTPTTPSKPTKESGAECGLTPSQLLRSSFRVVDSDDLPWNSEEFDESPTEIPRILNTTRVMNIYQELHLVLQQLYTALHVMTLVGPYRRKCAPSCLLHFHKDANAVTFHQGNPEELRPDFDRFPRSQVKHLIALEDLGRGLSPKAGKVWLCATTTKSSPSVCVLKFGNELTTLTSLQYEMETWKFLYPEFNRMIKVEKWSGSEVLVMPHFSRIFEDEREQYKDLVREELLKRFLMKNKVHKEVHWRNIGKYIASNRDTVIVVYDLKHVVEYNPELHVGWLDQCMATLFPPV